MLYFNGNHRKTLFFAHFHMFTSAYLFFVLLPETCTAALGQKNPQNYFKEKSIFMSSGRYLCIVYVKLKVKKQNSIDRIIIVKRKPNFIKFYLK
jgi:hypothetical protein